MMNLMEWANSLVARLRFILLRAALRAAGFDIVSTRRICNQAKEAQSTVRAREQERAEIHMLAQGLGLLRRESRSDYERVIATFFPGHKSSTTLSDMDHRQLLNILRAWKCARAVQKDRAVTAA